MGQPTRRAVLAGGSASLAILLAGCETAPEPDIAGPPPGGFNPSREGGMYGPVPGEPFPIPAVDLARIEPQFLRQEVPYATDQAPGTIVVDPGARHLYHVGAGGWAMRYGVGVGREGFGWSGTATIESKQEWPDWYPPKEMVERQPELLDVLTELRGGLGMPGGPRNPLGARALYLWEGGRDTLYRIHGTFEPWTIGRNVSSGCIRLINQDAIHLYEAVPVGTTVVVLPTAGVA